MRTKMNCKIFYIFFFVNTRNNQCTGILLVWCTILQCTRPLKTSVDTCMTLAAASPANLWTILWPPSLLVALVSWCWTVSVSGKTHRPNFCSFSDESPPKRSLCDISKSLRDNQALEEFAWCHTLFLPPWSNWNERMAPNLLLFVFVSVVICCSRALLNSRVAT